MKLTLLRHGTGFWFLILGFSVYSSVFMYRTTFIVRGERYSCLFDDAMISMRYARNLAAGDGLVWNPGGERVEGFTNPGWVLYMAILHLLPLHPSKVSLFVQATGALLLLANLFVTRRIACGVSGDDAWVVLPAVALTAFYLPLNCWGLQGMEVSALTLITSVAVCAAIRSHGKTGVPSWALTLLAFGTWIRIDMLVPTLSVISFLAVFDRTHRRRYLFHGLGALAGCLFLQSALRYWYYGDLLPNTYYLKMTGYPFILRVARGAYVFVKFVYRMNYLVFLTSMSRATASMV